MRVVDWLLDTGWGLATCLLVLFALFVGLAYLSGRDVESKCAETMRLARSARDSLDVRIACNKMHSDANTALSISIGAGVIAGSRR